MIDPILSVVASPAFGDGFRIAASLGLTLGLGVYASATAYEPENSYVLGTLALTGALGAFAFVGADSVATAVAFTFGVVAWNLIQYYLAPGVLFGLVFGLPRLAAWIGSRTSG